MFYPYYGYGEEAISTSWAKSESLKIDKLMNFDGLISQLTSPSLQ